MNIYCIVSELQDRYDTNQIEELSNDKNSPDAYWNRVQRILDAQANRFDGYVSTRFGSTPISVNATSLSVAASAAATSITVTNGLTLSPQQYIVLMSDGTHPYEKVLIESISGNVVTLSNLTPLTYSHLVGTGVNLVPGPITDWVAVQSMQRLFFRRNSEPDGLELDFKDSNEWMERLLAGKITLPGIQRVAPSVLVGTVQPTCTTSADRCRFNSLINWWW